MRHSMLLLRRQLDISRIRRYFALFPLSILLSSCGGGGGGGGGGGTPPPPVTYTAQSGVAQKGPLIKGSTVTAQELNAALSPTGKQYSYQITTDLGAFSPTSTFTSQYIGLSATGYYFDEVSNAVSTGTVTLNGYSDLTVDSVLNVNLLTTLAYQRIQNLVTSSNMAFTAATTQAENEVLAAVNIPSGSYGSFGTLDLGGSSDGDHILAAISSIFVYGHSAGPMSALIADFQSDIGTNGVITDSATKAALLADAKALNPTTVAANLTQEYSSAGVTFTAANISDWIDQDGDGVIGKFKFQVADATPSTVFTLPTFVVDQVAGTSVSVTGGILTVNQVPITGSIVIQKGDSVSVSPGAGAFPSGVLVVYLNSGTIKAARISFVSGLLTIAVTPDAPSVPNGLTQQFKATGTFSDTSTSDLTNSVIWKTDSPTVAVVNAATGLAHAVAVGSAIITATSGLVSGSTMLNITPAVVQSVTITPNPATVGIGLNQQLTATGSFSDGSQQDVTTAATWSSDTTSVATVGQSTGKVTGVAAASANISAAIGTVVASVPLSVVTQKWVTTGALVTDRYYHTATMMQNGTVLVAGGEPSGNGAPPFPPILPSAEIHDAGAGVWTTTGSMATARGSHTATLLADGTVLVAGGTTYSTSGGCCSYPSVASAEIYNPSTGTWTATGSMTTVRSYHTATLLPNGTVLVAGGQTINPNITATAEIYSPATGTWTATGSMTTGRQVHTATLLPNGTVLVAGGQTANLTATAEIYDPTTGTWAATGDMTLARASHTATLLPNGTVLVAGGQSTLSPGVTRTAEIYDPTNGIWAVTGDMTQARNFYTATLLGNGTVMVAGGSAGTSSATAEIYSPATGTWMATGSMTTGRQVHTATLLPNGTVLAVGGSQVGASAEIYYP